MDFEILQDFVETGLLHIDQFPSDRQNRLKSSVAPLLGRAPCGIAFHDVKLGQIGIAFGAIGELARQTAAGQRGLAHRFSGFSGGLAGPGGHQTFVDDFFGNRGIFFAITADSLVSDRLNQGLDFVVDQFSFGLRAESRIRQFHAQNADQTLSQVVSGEVRILFLQDVVGFGVILDGVRQSSLETLQVHPAVAIRDGVGETLDMLGVSVGILEDHIDVAKLRFVVHQELAHPAHDDWFRMD